MKHPIVFCLGVALAMSVGACNKHSQSDSSSPAASAAVANAPADSAAADPAPPAPPDSAAVPTEQDYEEQATKTVSTSQSLDSQVNAIAKEIAGPTK